MKNLLLTISIVASGILHAQGGEVTLGEAAFRNYSDWPAKGIDPFDEVETFEPGSFIWHLGSTLGSDIDFANRDLVSAQLPGLHLTLDKAIAKNIGLGIKFGTQWWKADKIGYNYRYYSLGVRGSYHFNLTDKLDPYLGINLTGRRFSIGNGEENVSDFNLRPGAVIGARYYLTDTFGVYGEFASDGIGNFHLGLALKLK